jgi:hypothetical protein
MEATIGDEICIHGNTVGHPDKHGEIVEVRGAGGEPPYLVRFADGHTQLLFTWCGSRTATRSCFSPARTRSSSPGKPDRHFDHDARNHL